MFLQWRQTLTPFCRRRTQVIKLLEEKGDSFDDKRAERASAAAAPLAQWVKANMKFYEVGAMRREEGC